MGGIGERDMGYGKNTYKGEGEGEGRESIFINTAFQRKGERNQLNKKFSILLCVSFCSLFLIS